jgi:hypothetical protein
MIDHIGQTVTNTRKHSLHYSSIGIHTNLATTDVSRLAVTSLTILVTALVLFEVLDPRRLENVNAIPIAWLMSENKHDLSDGKGT